MGAIESWVRRVILRGSNGNEMSVNTDGSLPVTIQGANSTGGALGVDVQQSEIIQPTDIQSHLQTTIQALNAVSIPLNGNSVQSSWMDCDGFDKIAITLLSDAATSNSISILWSNDNTTVHADESALGAATSQKRAGITDIKARYAKLSVNNLDATAAHTMSVWAFLKA